MCYATFSLVATVGEARTRLFPTYFSKTQSMADAKEGAQQQH